MSAAPTPVRAKYTHYVSNPTGAIHIAMSSPAGYEDEHPQEWRPATRSEIERFKTGVDMIDMEPVSIDEAFAGAETAGAYQPQSLRLEPEPPVAAAPLPPVQIVPPGPAPVAAPPAAPEAAGAVPAFNTDLNAGT